MGKKREFGCKKCGAVIHVELISWTNRIEVKLDNATAQDRFGTTELRCKKCNFTVATVGVDPS